MTEDAKNKILAICLAALALLLALSIIQGVSYIFDLIRVKTSVPLPKVSDSSQIMQEKKLEDDEIIIIDLPTHSSSTLDKKIKNITLLSQNFIPPQNIYQPDVYSKNVIKVAIIGEFDMANLKVRGEVNNDLKNLINISIGQAAGVLGTSRTAENRLDLKTSTAIFDKQHPMIFSLNLMEKIKLSTLLDEYKSTYQPYKELIIWDEIKPPAKNGTIMYVLIAPISERGIYGDGSLLTNIEFEFKCSDGMVCDAKVCVPETRSNDYECVKQSFDPGYSNPLIGKDYRKK